MVDFFVPQYRNFRKFHLESLQPINEKVNNIFESFINVYKKDIEM